MLTQSKWRTWTNKWPKWWIRGYFSKWVRLLCLSVGMGVWSYGFEGGMAGLSNMMKQLQGAAGGNMGGGMGGLGNRWYIPAWDLLQLYMIVSFPQRWGWGKAFIGLLWALPRSYDGMFDTVQIYIKYLKYIFYLLCISGWRIGFAFYLVSFLLMTLVDGLQTSNRCFC